MLQLYYARPSIYSRPVWLALLEKQLSFELIPVDVGGEQFTPEFLALNPFSHIPVLVDGDVRVIESLAILDYLEARYPQRPLLPSDAATAAKVRMVQLVVLNELLPAMIRLLIYDKSSTEESTELQYAQLRAGNTLAFLEDLLDQSTYFAGEQLTLAEIVAGTLIYRLPDLGIALAPYPRLMGWSERLIQRPTWKDIELSADEWSQFRRRMRAMPKLQKRRRRRQIETLSANQTIIRASTGI